ncbi:MAG: hypothetical protein AVDCRST_MAG10-2213 [uncultured Acidimicrobiales bacterium]|uniref:Uncharacterized protein n=1 Tax=uncultured Acidimicrobiales bacterium TaxID=310071 RepID=A0A6J4IID5_9ACTN|nr:MAG: hypothetical protein AVDCRST_MAG10-2213 [uncultured Acidimicrobiales bacterium]
MRTPPPQVRPAARQASKAQAGRSSTSAVTGDARVAGAA